MISTGSIAHRAISIRWSLLRCALLLPTISGVHAAEPVVGDSFLVGGQWFQFLGREDGCDRWLYPHPDGVHEVFEVDGHDRDRWHGLLGSEFDASSGRFPERFSAVECLNAFLDTDLPRAERARAARYLRLYERVRGVEEELPYYLRPSRERWTKWADRDDRAWIDARVAEQTRWIHRVEMPGTRVLSVPESLVDSDDFYRALIADGYLDFAVVGGNSRDEETGKVYSWLGVEGLREELEGIGFETQPMWPECEGTITEKTVRLLGQPVRVRVIGSGGSHREPRIRRAVATFVEGLAHADVVIYEGHSNHRSGEYFLSESKSSFSKFQIGLDDQRDLRRKCHGLRTQRYQIVALQSCYSFEKYCQPIGRFCDEELRDRVGRTGYVGTADIAYFPEFVPRYRSFVLGLVEGRGPRELAETINALRPVSRPAPIVMRGLLQPRYVFIVPAGVEILRWEETGPERGFLVIGQGSDDVEYYGTDVFPQNRSGEIVQVAPGERGVFGLDRDGRVLYVGRETAGVAVELAATRESGHRIRFIATAQRRARQERLFVITTDGELLYVTKSGARLLRFREELPAPAVRVGNDPDDDLIVETADGRFWIRTASGWDPTEPRPLPGVTPSLIAIDRPGALWMRPRPF
ncbi:MAG: hypothetical protein KDC38_00050 [Planctomycetes bacterium]|nr:hypothetical protein [Planctomycetota bacterium]